MLRCGSTAALRHRPGVTAWLGRRSGARHSGRSACALERFRGTRLPQAVTARCPVRRNLSPTLDRRSRTITQTAVARPARFPGQDLLRAATEVAAERGPAGATVAAIAKAAGAPTGSLYHR